MAPKMFKSIAKRLNKERYRGRQSRQICREFSLDEIKTATRNFDEELIIGKAGFGFVYKGSINDGAEAEVVAIKRWVLNFQSNKEKVEVLREIQTLSKIQHDNLVRLKGYCSESPEMILVYEYIPNGTLVDHLYKNKGSTSLNGDNQQYGLTWEQRLNICIGAAQGLTFLHRVPDDILQGNIKDSNILLDSKFVAKIANFGLTKLAKITTESQTTIVSLTGVKGTFGYLDPEFTSTQMLTKKSDVYAFGVVLLVVLCGRPAILDEVAENQRSLALWAQDCIDENRANEIIDPYLAGKISSMSLNRFLKVSQECQLQSTEQRPTMEEVVLGLKLALEEQTAVDGTTSRSTGEEKLVLSRSLTRKTCQRFSIGEIRTATQKFSDELIIRRGGFGTVYKGHLEFGLEVAIERIRLGRGEIMFWREIETLSKLQHSHVVHLRGYWYKDYYEEKFTEMDLVYEYMSQGSLEEHLHKRGNNEQDRLTWEQRLNICLCTARGLDYLHRVIEPGVIHCDVKCDNILLDNKFVAKISNFKMSELDDGSDKTITVAGTSERLTTKVDVYGFGVIMLAVLSGRSEVHNKVEEDQPTLAQWAQDCIDKNRVDEIIDVQLAGKISDMGLKQFLKVSQQCLLPNPEERPTMEEVVLGLDLALGFEREQSKKRPAMEEVVN